jgi:hypothetical protein
MTVIPVKGHRATLSGCAWGWSSAKAANAPSTWAQQSCKFSVSRLAAEPF